MAYRGMQKRLWCEGERATKKKKYNDRVWESEKIRARVHKMDGVNTQQNQTWETNQIENSKKWCMCTIFRIIFARIANQLSNSLFVFFSPFQFIQRILDSGVEHCFAVYFYCYIGRFVPHISHIMDFWSRFRAFFYFRWSSLWNVKTQSTRGNRTRSLPLSLSITVFLFLYMHAMLNIYSNYVWMRNAPMTLYRMLSLS